MSISAAAGCGRAIGLDTALSGGWVWTFSWPQMAAQTTQISMILSDSMVPGYQHGFRWQIRLLILACSLLQSHPQFHLSPHCVNLSTPLFPISPSCTLSFPFFCYMFVRWSGIVYCLLGPGAMVAMGPGQALGVNIAYSLSITSLKVTWQLLSWTITKKNSAVNIFLYVCEYTEVFSVMNVEKCMSWAHRKKDPKQQGVHCESRKWELKKRKKNKSNSWD